ncbi:MAG: tetratricopeptide repeat protein [Anaerolineae bacterium]|nr:tetratricopeptide repeat protein [Anaerolineae bacterium]
MQETLADVLGEYVERSRYSRGQLAALSGLPKRTVANWLKGRVQKPQQWQGLVILAAVLHLDESETSRLLQAAQHPSVAELRQTVTAVEDIALLTPWLQTEPPPFQAISDLPYFVGREQTLAQLKEVLLQGAFVNVCNLQGMGGVGKTAVAAHLAYQLKPHFPDGVLWANLAASDTMTILSQFAQTYNHDVSGQTDVKSRSALVRGILAHKRALVILDDAQSSQQLAHLLPPSTGKTAVVITTRHDLAAADGLKRFEIRPFTRESGHAFTLFASLMGKTRARQHQAELLEVAELLGHLPLALAIVAARLAYSPQLKVADLLVQIRRQEARLDELNRGEDRNVRLSVDTSFQALSADQQTLFTSLGVFGGDSFSVEAVAAVIEVAPETAAARLRELVQLSLVRAEGHHRYSLHPLLRDYAREKIGEKALFARMVIYYGGYVRQHEFDYVGLVQETSGIVAAFQSAFEHKLDIHLIEGINRLYPFLEARGLHQIAERHLEQALQMAQANGHNVQTAFILSHYAHQAYIQADYGQAEIRLQTALSLTEPEADASLRSGLLYNLAAVYTEQGQFVQAEAELQEALTLARQSEDLRNCSDILSLLGKVVAVSRGDYEQVEAYLQEAYQLAQQVGDSYRVGNLLIRLGSLAYHRGRWQRAEAYYQEALALARQSGNRRGEMNALHDLGVMAQSQGQFAQAETYFQAGMELAETISLNEMMIFISTCLGEVAREQGKLDAAKKHLQRAVSMARTINHPANLSYALANLGAIFLGEQDYGHAEVYLREGLDLALRAGQVWDKFTALRWWGEWWLAQEIFEEAKAAWQQAQALAEASGTDELRGMILFHLARLEQARGNLSEGLRLARESEVILKRLGHYWHIEVGSWVRTYEKVAGN